MRTTVKIETSGKSLEVELKLVNGKQIVELELSKLLSLIEGNGAKSTSAAKPAKKQSIPKATKGLKVGKPTTPTSGAKRGRKPKSATGIVVPLREE